MRKLAALLAASMLLAGPALAQNQFPDPNLLDPSGLLMTSVPAGSLTYELPALVFNGGTTAYQTAGAVDAALLAAWGVGEDRQVSAYVAAYSSGDLKCRFRGGAYVNLGLAGTGMSAPVTITAGSGSTGFACVRVGSAVFTLQARPSNGDPIFNIAP